MKRLIFVLCILTFCALAYGRPLVIQETQWLRAPAASLTYFGESVGIDGDWAIATALRSADGSYSYPYQQLALLYRRVNGSWVYQRTLVDDDTDEESWNHPSVAMANGLASVSTSPLRAFRRVGDEWVETPAPFPAGPGSASWANGLTRIDGTTVAALANRCFVGAGTSEFVDGAWTPPRFVTGNARICDIANYASSLDVSGNTLALTNPQEDSPYPPTELRIYARPAPGQAWQLEDSLPIGEWGRGVALLGGDLIVGDYDPLGNPVYRRGADGWERTGHLPTLLGYSRYYDGAYHIARGGDFALFSSQMFEDLPGSIAVYRRLANGGYEHVALLMARNGDRLGNVVDISGNSVVVGGYNPDSVEDGRLYFFELPESFAVPDVIQDDFEDGDAAGWQQVSGDFDVTQRGVTRVLRQSRAEGSGNAVLTASNFTTESLTADIRIRDFDGDDRWVGLATRYRDPDNHYYATLRSGGSVEFRRVRDGRITVLASQALAVTENSSYRMRLESVGSQHRVFVNGQARIVVTDPVFGRGRVALMTYGAAADFDNVVVTPSVRQSIYETDIVNGGECERFVTERGLRVSGSPQWDCSVYERPFLRQTSTTGVARAALGPVTDDQVVESRVHVEQFATNGMPGWLGVMTRYDDADNHYFLALEATNEVTLNKLVDGSRVELDRVPLTLAPTAWYRLRLEAVGDRLRGYVNNILYVQATDATHPRGISGIVTSSTAARFDYFRVHQP